MTRLEAFLLLSLGAAASPATVATALEPPASSRDPRNLRAGSRIPDEGYCDQPYTIVNADGSWLCTLTTGKGREGDRGQHIVSTRSADRGRTWSELVDIEPADGPEASWAMPLLTPGGRVYVFYTYNGDGLRTWDDKPIRADTVGWYCYKYSDDGGRSWSRERHRLPLPLAPVDRTNTFGGKHQIFWGIGKPVEHGGTVWFAFSRCGKHVVDRSEGWFFRSRNILGEPDPSRIEWTLLPDGDRGLRSPEHGEVHAEQNLVALEDGSLYCMYRTLTGYPFCAYSRDGGHTWTTPTPATYTPGGKKMKTPRACPRIWRTREGRYLFWFHHHGDVRGAGWTHRNPAWISGGVERDGLIHWSQPEILLYDPDPSVRTSYPDLIEEDGGYWIAETQKTVARVHEVDRRLLEGLWRQGEARSVARDGLLLELGADGAVPKSAELPDPLDVEAAGGLSLEAWLRLEDLAAGQVILGTAGDDGRGLVLRTAGGGTIRLELDDGSSRATWEADPGLLETGKVHHVTAIVDAGPRIVIFVVDGVVCDGGEARPYGWGRYEEAVGDVRGTGVLRVAPDLRGEVLAARIYGRYLRVSEAIGNRNAGRP